MLRFFSKMRFKLAAQNKVAQYLRYAIGEIVLVVIGILIALQVNNWNINRKARNDFEFSINEFYKQMQIDVYSYNSLVDRFSYQVEKMDSIIQGHTSAINSEDLPGIIQLFDDNWNILYNTNNEWQKNFLKLNPGDEEQNDMVRLIHKYYEDQFNFQGTLQALDMDNLMTQYLRDWNIPVRFISSGDLYADFISDHPPGFYSETHLSAVKKLIKDESFIADLKSLKKLKAERIFYSKALQNSGQMGLDYLRQVYPSIRFKINTMEIIGSATPNHDWSYGIPMKKTTDSTWEISMELSHGGIKFRTDAAWTFDWGLSQTDSTRLVFRGGDIPVRPGKYHITIDINADTFTLNEL